LLLHPSVSAPRRKEKEKKKKKKKKKKKMSWIIRFISILGFLALGALLYSSSSSSSSFSSASPSRITSFGVALRLAHLLSFATAWGVSLWVTFIGGIIMFK
jgi:flagellar basal body-associated protein FliL